MELLKAIEGIRTPFWDPVMSAVTYLGDELIFMAGVLLVLWCIDKKWGYRLFIMGMAGTIVNQFLKAIFVVPRPWVRDPAFTIVESAREGASGYSFPSGHTQSAATLFGGVAAWRKDSWRATLICTLLVLLTGFSRMYLGVHTPADVFTSLGTGLVMVVGFSLAFAKAENSRKGKYAIGLGTLALAAAALIYVLAAPKGPGHVAEFDEAGLKACYTALGTVGGLCVVYLIDERKLQYSIKAVWWAQVLKYVIGLALLVAIKSVIKAPLRAMCGGNVASDGIRYFIITLLGGVVWPLTFKWWGKLGKKKE